MGRKNTQGPRVSGPGLSSLGREVLQDQVLRAAVRLQQGQRLGEALRMLPPHVIPRNPISCPAPHAHPSPQPDVLSGQK